MSEVVFDASEVAPELAEVAEGEETEEAVETEEV